MQSPLLAEGLPFLSLLGGKYQLAIYRPAPPHTTIPILVVCTTSATILD
jgi:hypothetical protein